jgi:hypothetical protein
LESLRQMARPFLESQDFEYGARPGVQWHFGVSQIEHRTRHGV